MKRKYNVAPGTGQRGFVPTRKFKCRWCGEAFPIYTHGQDNVVGARVYGGDRLVEHAEQQHPEEVRAMRRALGHDTPVRLPDGLDIPEDGEPEL